MLIVMQTVSHMEKYREYYGYVLIGLGIKVIVCNATFNNNSVPSWRSVLLIK
jgi:hypothetical protein